MPRLVTVLLPTLNCEAHLIDTLDSLAAQSMRDFKVLILDGGSSDNTTGLAGQYERVQIEIVHCGRIGLGAQLRMGLMRVDTRYVARMDADDLSLTTRFERQIKALEVNPELVIVGSQIELLIGGTVCRAASLPQEHECIRRALLAGFPAFCHPAVMFRAEPALRSGGYTVSGLGEDLDFYLRITETGEACNLPEVLHRYRLHRRSASFTSFEEIRRNYVYALECTGARRDQKREPSAVEFMARWNCRGKLERLGARLECFGAVLYRRSRIWVAEGKMLKGVLGGLLSVLVRPRLLRVRLLILVSAWRNAAGTV